RDGAIYLPEGASDTLALSALGLPAIGRPSNTGGADHLATLLRDVPRDRQIVVLAECDPKADGKWPGRDGAIRTATTLAEKLGRAVHWAVPANGGKDVRAWTAAQNLPTVGEGIAEDWQATGERFVAGLKLQERKVDGGRADAKKSGNAANGLVTTCLANIQPIPIHWLVPGVLPLGKLFLLAGAGGRGKSSPPLNLAACLSTGLPSLGREYGPSP